MVKPWVDAGVECTIVDALHPPGITEGNPRKIGTDLSTWFPDGHYDVIFAFPPCTLLCRPASQWWYRHGGRDAAVNMGMGLVNKTIQIIAVADPMFWLIENPTGQIPKEWRKWDLKFHPAHFGGWNNPPAEGYTKETCLWFSPDFPVLERREAPKPWLRHDAWISEAIKAGVFKGPGVSTASKRSKTPVGLSYAVFNALYPILLEKVGQKAPAQKRVKPQSVGRAEPSLLLSDLKKAGSRLERDLVMDQIREAVLYNEISGAEYFEALQVPPPCDKIAGKAISLPSKSPLSKGPARVHSVGSKELEEWEDPQTPPDRLVKIAKKEPRAYLNPNMPWDGLFDGATYFPWLIDANPVIPLLRLEDPSDPRLVRLRNATKHGWREQGGLNMLSEKGRRLYLADCAERAMTMLSGREKYFKKLKQAIQVARDFAHGKSSKAELSFGHAQAQNISTKLWKDELDTEKYVADAVVALTQPDMQRNHVINGTGKSLWALQRKDQFESETDWQLARVKHYIYQEHPELKPVEVVGAKPKWSDASLPSDKLVKHVKTTPKTLMNPNLPFETLIEGAQKFPWFVERNPALALFSLEDPAKAERIETALSWGWVASTNSLKNEEFYRSFLVDCAEHVLPIYEKQYPNDNRPRKAIEVARLNINGLATLNELRLAAHEADLAADAAKKPASKAARSAYYAASYRNSAPYYAMDSAAVFASELAWQVERARFYYAKEHPEYRRPESVGAKPKWNDASLPAEQLIKLAKKNPKTFSNPNLPMGILLKAAYVFPWYVEQNPALVMLSLEDPASYKQLSEALKAGWLGAAIEHISEESQREFAIACAERILPILRHWNVGSELREAVEAARKYARGQITRAELTKAHERAKYRSHEITRAGADVNHAVVCAADAAQSAAEENARNSAETVSIYARHAHWNDFRKGTDDFDAETLTQVAHLQALFAKEHPWYKRPDNVGATSPFGIADQAKNPSQRQLLALQLLAPKYFARFGALWDLYQLEKPLEPLPITTAGYKSAFYIVEVEEPIFSYAEQCEYYADLLHMTYRTVDRQAAPEFFWGIKQTIQLLNGGIPCGSRGSDLILQDIKNLRGEAFVLRAVIKFACDGHWHSGNQLSDVHAIASFLRPPNLGNRLAADRNFAQQIEERLLRQKPVEPVIAGMLPSASKKAKRK